MRCRTKRKVWVNALEENADNLEKQNKELHQKYVALKEEVRVLKIALLNKQNNNSIYPVNLAINANAPTHDHHLNEPASGMSLTNLDNQPQSTSTTSATTSSEPNRPNSNLFEYLIAATKRE